MSETPRIKFASDILVQLTHTIHAMNRLTSQLPPQPPADDRRSALYQLKISVEVLHKLAEVARVDAVMAQRAAESAAAEGSGNYLVD